MKITKVYYKELRSKKVNGMFTNVEIGVEVSLNENVDMMSAAVPSGLENPDDALMLAKDYVRSRLDREVEIEPTTVKYKLINIKKDIKKAIESLDNQNIKIGLTD